MAVFSVAQTFTMVKGAVRVQFHSFEVRVVNHDRSRMKLIIDVGYRHALRVAGVHPSDKRMKCTKCIPVLPDTTAADVYTALRKLPFESTVDHRDVDHCGRNTRTCRDALTRHRIKRMQADQRRRPAEGQQVRTDAHLPTIAV